MEKDIEERLNKIEDFLRHIHEHVENIDSRTWAIKEGLPYIVGDIGNAIEDLQKGKEFDGKGEKLVDSSKDFLEQMLDSTDELYTPIDEKDKEKNDKEVEERERKRDIILRSQLRAEYEKKQFEEYMK
jgi:DNA repair ATPase RecN